MRGPIATVPLSRREARSLPLVTPRAIRRMLRRTAMSCQRPIPKARAKTSPISKAANRPSLTCRPHDGAERPKASRSRIRSIRSSTCTTGRPRPPGPERRPPAVGNRHMRHHRVDQERDFGRGRCREARLAAPERRARAIRASLRAVRTRARFETESWSCGPRPGRSRHRSAPPRGSPGGRAPAAPRCPPPLAGRAHPPRRAAGRRRPPAPGSAVDRRGTRRGRARPRPSSRGAGRAAHPCILADIAGDVGELHGGAEIAGAGERIRGARAHDQRHHGPDRARDPGRRSRAARPGPRSAVPPRPRRTLDQGVGQRFGIAYWPTISRRPGRRRIGGCARIGQCDPAAETRDRVASVGRVGRLVDEIVGEAAEGVEPVGRLAHLAGQQLPAAKKLFEPARIATRQAVRSAALANSGGNAGIRNHQIEDSGGGEPAGRPAPGCVPAPTRYRLRTSLDGCAAGTTRIGSAPVRGRSPTRDSSGNRPGIPGRRHLRGDDGVRQAGEDARFEHLGDPAPVRLGEGAPILAAGQVRHRGQHVEGVATRRREARIRGGRPVQVEARILGQDLAVEDVREQPAIARARAGSCGGRHPGSAASCRNTRRTSPWRSAPAGAARGSSAGASAAAAHGSPPNRRSRPRGRPRSSRRPRVRPRSRSRSRPGYGRRRRPAGPVRSGCGSAGPAPRPVSRSRPWRNGRPSAARDPRSGSRSRSPGTGCRRSGAGGS